MENGAPLFPHTSVWAVLYAGWFVVAAIIMYYYYSKP